MGVFIFTKNEAQLKNVFAKTAQFLPYAKISKHAPKNGDVSYIDISDMTGADVDKHLLLMKKACKTTSWGTINPKGDSKEDAAQNGSSLAGTGIKLPAESAFPGWKKMQPGKVMPFYILYCSLQGKVPLDARLDAKTIAQIHKNFLAHIDDSLADSDGLLWMNSGQDCVFLIPPKAKYAEAAIKACINMIVSAPLIVMETLGITVQANFIFALHYGSLSYKPPGKTGTVVSDAINFIFHLGAKKAEPGRLVVSGELPDKSIPQALQDCFVPAGEFEGRKIWQTKKFTYEKPWM